MPETEPLRCAGNRVLVQTDDDEVFAIGKLDDSQLVTLRLASGSYIRFQVDTGAQCNVVPLELYKKATKDHDLTRVTPSRTSITAYGGTTSWLMGKTSARYWDEKHALE
jgi:hypothetical protein